VAPTTAISAQRAREFLGLAGTGKPGQSAWAVLRVPGFGWYFAGSVCSDLGTWVQNTAQVLLAYHITHSVMTVALVSCAQFTSPLVLGPWAGVLADRFGGRRTLLWTEIGSAVIAAAMAALALTGHLDQTWLIIGAIAIGLAFTFALPARNVTIRRLVPAEDVRAGYAMDSVSYNLGRALGPPAGIALIATVGAAWAFVVNAISFGVFTGALLLLNAIGGSAEPVARRSRVRDGFLVAYRDKRVLIVLLMVVAVTVAADPVLVLGPALASHVFGVSATWSGLFIAALGAGSVAGSLVPLRSRPSIRLAATALSSLGICMLVFVLAPSVIGSVLAAAAAGLTCLIANSVTRTVLATVAGPYREASVMAIWAIAWAGSKPIASLADGTLATWIGVRWTGALLALPVFIPILALAARDWLTRPGNRQAATAAAR